MSQHDMTIATSGADGGAFDGENDAELIRAFSTVFSPNGLIKNRWDSFVKYNEADLIEVGILEALIAEGGLVNGAQFQRLECGAIWQLHTESFDLRERRQALTARLAATEERLASLPN